MAKVQWCIRLCVALYAVAAVTSSVHVSEVLMTQATLLGGLDKDCTPNATTTCEVNMVEAVAWCRNLTATGVVHAFLPTLDRSHILTKLHPKDWGANFALHKQLNAAVGFLSTFSFTADATLAQYSVRRDDAPLVDDFDFPVGHNLRPALTARLVETATSLHIVTSRRRLQDLDTVAAQAAVAMEKSDTFREQQGAYKNTMLIVSDSSPEEYAPALAKHGARPEIICRFLASTDSVEFKNDTWMVNVKTDKTHLHRLAIHRLSNTSSTIVNVTLTAQPLDLPAANRTDAQYVADRAMMKAEAMIAAANNPVQGSTAGPMPAPTAPDGAALCRRGECPMGNMWTDAIRNATGSDVAFFSGPWLKGPGWTARNVTLRETYTAYGFIEMAGELTVLGLSLFELWNHSLAASAFDPYMPTSQAGARHLPQVSGMRVKYNLARADVNDRLISIEVWDKEHNEYRPLERLKKYTVSGPQFLLQNSGVQSKYLKATYTGEKPMAPISETVQDLFRRYLARTKGEYTPGIFGRMIEDNTSDVSMKDWNHQVTGCAVNFVMDSGVNTCVACAEGTERPMDAAECTPITSNELSTSVIVAIAAGSCVFFLVIGMAAFLAFTRWQRHKRTRYCPRDSSRPITAFFVTVRNEVAVRERFPTTAHTAFKRIEEAVSKAANDHKCFVARRLGAHFLVVGSDPAEAVRAAADVQAAIDATAWHTLLQPSGNQTVKGEKPIPVDPRRRIPAARGSSLPPCSPPTPSAIAPSSAVAPSAVISPAAPVLLSVAPTPSNWTSELSGTPRSVTEQSNASTLMFRPMEVAPLVSAGMAFGTATIHHDDEVDTWLYSGLAVDAAAAVADTARPGQFLATDALCDAVSKDAVGAVFSNFGTRRMTCPVAHVEKPVQLLQMDCAGLPPHHFAEISVIDSDTAGALTAALETAAGGLTSRTVGAVCWTVPALRSPKAFASRSIHTKQLEAVIAAITKACAASKADLVSAVDGTFLAVVNGSAARTAQVATTTTALARAGVAAVRKESKLFVVSGVATGPAMAGALNSTVVVSGVAAERARLLATVSLSCTTCEPPVASPGIVTTVVPASMTNDLDPHYVLAVVDAIAWPDHCVAQNSTASRDPLCVYAVMGEKVMEEDEWLYQLEAASTGNPYSRGNAVFSDVVAGACPATDAAHLDHPEVTEHGDVYPSLNVHSLMASLDDAAAHSSTRPTVTVLRVLQERLRTTCCAFSRADLTHEEVPVAWPSSP